jgi:hemerythrin-like domain-containing protein
MNAIQILVSEHDQILTMIRIVETILSSDDEGALPVDDLHSLIDFIRNFADKYHHLKEEDVLFAEMGNYGMSHDSGPIAVMLHEHNQGRDYIRKASESLALYEAGDVTAVADIRFNLLSYAELLTNHIQKENRILYPMAEKLLPVQVIDTMTQNFVLANATTLNNEYNEKYLKMVTKLSLKYL